MLEREGNFVLKCVSLHEIFLLVLATFAFAFIIGNSSFANADSSALLTGNRAGSSQQPGYYQTNTGNAGPFGQVTLVQQVDESGVLKFYRTNGEGTAEVTKETAEQIASTFKTDIKGSSAFSLKTALQQNKGTMADLRTAQLPEGSTLVSHAQNPDGTVTSVIKDAAGVDHTYTGKATDSISSVVAQASGSSAYSYEVPLIGYKITNFLGGNLVQGLIWSMAVVGAIQLIGPLLGADQQLTNALSASAFAGIMSGKLAYGLFGQATPGVTGSGGVLGTALSPMQAGLIGVGVAVVVFVLLYKKESKKTVELQCLPWEAPLGGSDCERCNQDPLKPCSEYRCKSLGQACELVNRGSSEERCTWVAKGDVNSPVITPSTNLLTVNHRYTDVQGRPPSRGTRIVRTDQTCIQPFTPLQFGVQLNEPAQCKIDIEGNKTFDQMSYYFGGSNLYRYNHSEIFRLPSPDSINAEGLEVPTEGNYNFYVRCRDANGNVNEDEFVFNLCVDKSPDTTPPIIEQTSINSGSSIQFGAQNVSLTAYVNEPAQCKWSFQDKAFDSMENAMSCSTHVYEQNAQQQYQCTTTLNGIQDRSENVFYFRCKDQPLKNESSRNVNQESYRFTLKGSQPLAILSVAPNETITGSADVVRVNLTVATDDGADEGKAVCYFSPSGREGTFVTMFSTNSFKHEQVLSLGSGAYTYAFRCIDAGGNAASANVSFSVFVDRAAPRVTRAYKEGPDALKLVTNEQAVCRYSPTSCNFVFSEGLPIQVLNPRDRSVHIVPWKPHEAYYVKCRDDYGNEPNPNACSIVVSATNAA